jgi:hypothetical protein
MVCVNPRTLLVLCDADSLNQQGKEITILIPPVQGGNSIIGNPP